MNRHRRVDPLDGRGAMHIDRVVRDCIAKHETPDITALRLQAAVYLSEILDHEL